MAFNWKQFIRAGADAAPHTATDPVLTETDLRIRRRSTVSSTKRGIIAVGGALAYLGSQSHQSWVSESPLFTVVGGAVTLLLLAACCVAGAIFWLVTKRAVVLAWAVDLLPFGGPRFRSAAGIFVLFWAFASAWDKLPGIRDLGLTPLRVLRWVVWIGAAGAWTVAILS